MLQHSGSFKKMEGAFVFWEWAWNSPINRQDFDCDIGSWSTLKLWKLSFKGNAALSSIKISSPLPRLVCPYHPHLQLVRRGKWKGQERAVHLIIGAVEFGQTWEWAGGTQRATSSSSPCVSWVKSYWITQFSQIAESQFKWIVAWLYLHFQNCQEVCWIPFHWCTWKWGWVMGQALLCYHFTNLSWSGKWMQLVGLCI